MLVSETYSVGMMQVYYYLQQIAFKTAAILLVISKLLRGVQGCQPPTSSNIENMIDDVTMHATLTSYSLTVVCHFKKKKKRKIFEILLSGSQVYKK